MTELERDREKLEDRNEALKNSLDESREAERRLRLDMEKQEWDHSRQVDDLNRQHRDTVDDLSRQHRTAVDELNRELDYLKEQESLQQSKFKEKNFLIIILQIPMQPLNAFQILKNPLVSLSNMQILVA